MRRKRWRRHTLRVQVELRVLVEAQHHVLEVGIQWLGVHREPVVELRALVDSLWLEVVRRGLVGILWLGEGLRGLVDILRGVEHHAQVVEEDSRRVEGILLVVGDTLVVEEGILEEDNLAGEDSLVEGDNLAEEGSRVGEDTLAVGDSLVEEDILLAVEDSLVVEGDNLAEELQKQERKFREG